MNMFAWRYSLSKISLLLIAGLWLFTFLRTKPWQENQIKADIVSYYGYLPAIYIYEDISLSFIHGNDFFGDKYWPETAPNGRQVIKTTMGLSILYAPFFFIGHWTAGIINHPQTGYSTPYQFFLFIGTACYLLLGFYFLRKVLLRYFSEAVSALTLLILFFGTNLYWYGAYAALMAHAYLFALIAILIFLTIRWHEKPSPGNSLLLGFVGGLATLVRPTMLLMMLIPMLYGLRNKDDLNTKIQLLLKNKLNLFFMLLAFVLAGVPQMIYWKIMTGDWLYFSYTGERFYFDRPHLMEGILGYRKGWLLYTPLMVFACIGLFFMKEKLQEFRLAVLLPFLISVYILLSWWAWWYGGGFGMRAFVDFYGILALPMAAFFQRIWEKKWIKWPLLFVVTALMILNLFQTHQFYKGIIHYDSMTKKAYWSVFGKMHLTPEFWEVIRPPDYDRARAGLPENYTEEEIKKGLITLDFEEGDSPHHVKTISQSGKYSYKLSPTAPYSPTVPVMLVSMRDYNIKKMMLEVSFYPKDSIPENNVHLVISFENAQGESHHYYSRDIASFTYHLNDWNKIKFSAPVPEKYEVTELVKMYLWYHGEEELLIDDVKIIAIPE